MKRNPLYSGSSWSRPVGGSARPPVKPRPVQAEAPAEPPKPTRLRKARARAGAFLRKHEKWAIAAACTVVAVVASLALTTLNRPRVYTQADIDAAVAHTLKNRKPDPARSAVAAEVIRPSVVRVTGYDRDPEDPTQEKPKEATEAPAQGARPLQPEQEAGAVSVGSGVVIDERGTILTNWHVAASAQYLKVTFADGSESVADIVGAQPEDDLAIIRARILPDDLKPATLVSTGGLRPGDEVVAVGFPFAIGPSVSAGIVSGLKREWVFTDKRRATNLIQFDAAANPGNSGGPLVNKDGEVLGIVTGILNPTEQHVFIGIGFAVPIENAAAAAGMSPF